MSYNAHAKVKSKAYTLKLSSKKKGNGLIRYNPWL